MSATPSEPESQSFIAVGRAIRSGFAAVVLGMSYPNINLALHPDAVAVIHRDRINDKPLPAITSFVMARNQC